MTSSDYPLLTLGGYETYQLAHIATFIADALARHRLSRRGPAGRAGRASALRDLNTGRTALDAARRSVELTPPHLLPRAIDEVTYESALQRISSGQRSADVVAMPSSGEPTWAVVGNVPGIGRVGAVVDRADLAHELRSHFLSRPIEELPSWAVVSRVERVPTLPERVDVARAIDFLDPQEPAHRAVAEALRGPDPYINAAVERRFPGLAPAPSTAPDGQQRPDHESGTVRDEGTSVVDPDEDRGQHQDRENGHQPGRQRVVPAQNEDEGREQLDVAPPQGATRDNCNEHGPERDADRAEQRAGGARRTERGDQHRGGAHGEGEDVRKPALPGVHHSSRGARNHQGQSNRGRGQPLRRRQARQPGQGRHGDHLGPPGAP